MDCEVERRAPPPIPCTMRQKMSVPSECDAPQKKLAIVKRMIEPTKYRLRPSIEPSQPVSGITITLAS